MELPKRKSTRLKGYDYSSPGSYFVTICTQGRKEILSWISVGTGVLDCPQNRLTKYGEIADKYIRQMDDFYDYISVDKYVIMPNHIHLIISILDGNLPDKETDKNDYKNSIIARFVSTFKRFCNKEYGENIWQGRSNDHIIRDEKDYKLIWEYIDGNVSKWEDDCFYTV